MSKGSSPPAAPDPVTVANAQTGSNIGTAVANSTLGNVNQVGPTGSTTFSNTGGYTDPTTGQWVPSYTETSTLNPTLASILSNTENTANWLSGAPAQNLAFEAANTTSNPLDPNQTKNNSIIAGGPEALYTPAATAAYDVSQSFLDPQWNQQQLNLTDQLSQGGIPVGSDAYNRAMTNFYNSKNQAYNTAANSAIGQGINAGNNMFGLAIQGQNQNLGQQAQIQQQPLNLLTQLYGGAAPVAA